MGACCGCVQFGLLARRARTRRTAWLPSGTKSAEGILDPTILLLRGWCRHLAPGVVSQWFVNDLLQASLLLGDICSPDQQTDLRRLLYLSNDALLQVWGECLALPLGQCT